MKKNLSENLQPKSVLKGRKSEFDGILEEEDALVPELTEDTSQPNNAEPVTENNVSNFACALCIILPG